MIKMREKSCKRSVKNLRLPPPLVQATEPVEDQKEPKGSNASEAPPPQLPLLRSDEQTLPVPEQVFRVDEPVSGVVNLLSLQAEVRELTRRLNEYIHKTDERFDKLAVLFHK